MDKQDRRIRTEQEAIKWIKLMSSDDYSESMVDGADRAEWCACLSKFFNITEEELKKGGEDL